MSNKNSRLPENSIDFAVSANFVFADILAFVVIVGKTTRTSQLSLTPNPGDPSRPKWRVRKRGRERGGYQVHHNLP
ncbi:unnamed protein product [Lasius platythorax]|uniref:Uncharacterized protein n=1 Tax=Lasius platythorax TaxID=488582 RepID=A0AAV2P814_9HYME